MPLNHIGPDPDHVPEQRAGLRPAAVIEQEMKAKERTPDPAIMADKKVQRAIARVETLREAQASNQVIQRAEARVRDAELDVQERQAAKLNKQRTETLQAAKAKARARIEREHIQRLTGFAQVAIKIGRVCVTLKIDRNMVGTTRLTTVNDATTAMKIATRESERMAALAQKDLLPVEQDTDRLIRELSHFLRRSIATGDTTIEVMD